MWFLAGLFLGWIVVAVALAYYLERVFTRSF